MNAKQKATLMLLAIMFSPIAFAADQKPVTRIDFNKMIDENNLTRSELKQGLEVKAEPELDANDEKIKVIDFVDVEVGWGEAPPVVDRRFDSVGEARVVKGF